MPLVSVIVPTHNRCLLLGHTLRSVLAQRAVELQVIVVDDGSSDATAQTVAGFADPRVVLLRNPHPLGVSHARNRGIAAADGDWIAFLDDDDLWAPDKLASQLAAVSGVARYWACGGAVTITGALRIVAGGPPRPAEAIVAELPVRNMVPAGASNVVAYRAALAEAGRFDPRLRHMADWDLWIRLSRVGLPAVVRQPVVAYRLHPGNASADTATISAELTLIAERYAELRQGVPVDRAYAFRWAAWHLLRVGRRREAVQAYARAVLAGDVASAARALAALLHPGIARRRLRRHLPDPAWAAHAAEWLAQLGA